MWRGHIAGTEFKQPSAHPSKTFQCLSQSDEISEIRADLSFQCLNLKDGREDWNSRMGKRLGYPKGKGSFWVLRTRQSGNESWDDKHFEFRLILEARGEEPGLGEAGENWGGEIIVRRNEQKICILYRIFFSLGPLTPTVLCLWQMCTNPSGKPQELNWTQSKNWCC